MTNLAQERRDQEARQQRRSARGPLLRRPGRLREGARHRRQLRHPGDAARLPADPHRRRRWRPARTSSPRNRSAWTAPASARCWTPTSRGAEEEPRRRRRHPAPPPGRLPRNDEARPRRRDRRHHGPALLLERRRHLVPRTGRVGQARHQGTDLAYQLHNWYHFVWICGDHICEQHVHNLDVCNWAMGNKHPVKAVGMGGRTSGRQRRPEGRRQHLRPLRHRLRVPQRRPHAQHVPADRQLREQRLRGAGRHQGHCQVNSHTIRHRARPRASMSAAAGAPIPTSRSTPT